MILSDFLSRQLHDDSNPHEMIPNLLNMQSILQSRYNNLGEGNLGKYLVQTRSQVKSSSVKLPEVHGVDKGLYLNIQPEKQVKKLIQKETKQASQIKPRLSQGRAELRSNIKTPVPPPINKPVAKLIEKTIEQPKVILKVPAPGSSRTHDKNVPIPDYAIPHTTFGDDSRSRMVKRKSIQDVSREIPYIQIQLTEHPPKLVKLPIPKVPGSLSDFHPEINKAFEENSSFQEGMISEMYQRPDMSYFHKPQELDVCINTGRLVQKLVLKQADIDKISKIIHRKVLKGTHLPVTVKEIQAGYLISPYFKDLYQYVAQNKLPSTKTAFVKWKH